MLFDHIIWKIYSKAAILTYECLSYRATFEFLGMKSYLGIMMSPPKESDDWSFKNFSNGFKKVMMTHPQFNDIGKNKKRISKRYIIYSLTKDLL